MDHTARSIAPVPFVDYTSIDCDPDLSRPLGEYRRDASLWLLVALSSACLGAVVSRIAGHRHS